MPLIGSMKNSNYLKKEDVGTGTLVTINRVVEENIAKQGEPEELKWNIYFIRLTSICHRSSYSRRRNKPSKQRRNKNTSSLSYNF